MYRVVWLCICLGNVLCFFNLHCIEYKWKVHDGELDHVERHIKAMRLVSRSCIQNQLVLDSSIEN